MFSSALKRGALILGGAAILLVGTVSWTSAQTVPTPTPTPANQARTQHRQALINLALANGGKDNVTVALARYHFPAEG